MSSGEAELYAIVSGIAEGSGVQSILRDFGIIANVRWFSDSSAAVGIVKRAGICKIRHLQTQCLWVQECISLGGASIHKIGTHSNPSDLLTKCLESNKINQFLQFLDVMIEGECMFRRQRRSSSHWCRDARTRTGTMTIQANMLRIAL